MSMRYQEYSESVDTVWGGGGQGSTFGEDATEFLFEEDSKKKGVRSSVQSGQIPTLFYI